MPLGADDAQAPGVPHPLGVGLDGPLVLLQLLAEEGPGLEDLLVVGVGIAGGLGDDLVGIPGLGQILLGHVGGVAPQHDIGAAARHVGGDGDGPGAAGLGHDVGLLLVVLGVEDLVGDALPLEHGREQLALLDGDGAHQDGLLLFLAFPDLADDGHELALFGGIDLVVVVHTDHGLVGGDLDDVEVIGPPELLLLGEGGARHAGELGIHAEIILEGDGGQGLALPVDGDAFLGLDGLVEALGIPPAEHEAAGKLVHDDDLPLPDHIVHVPLHAAVGLDGLVDVVQEGGVLRVGEVAAVKVFFRLFHAPGGDGGGVGLFVDEIVAVQLVLALLLVHLHHFHGGEGAGKAVGLLIEVGGLVPLAGDDERGPGLVDEDGVHLVHHGEEEGPLDHILLEDGHVVPEIVKAHLVVGAVGDVGGIGLPPLLGGEPVDEDTAAQPHEAVDVAHHLPLVFGQVVVDGDDVYALARQSVEVGGEGGGQGLALAGLHLGDAPLVEDDAADDLDPEGELAQHPAVGLPHGGKGLRQKIIQGLPRRQPFPEPGGLGLEVGIAEGGIFGLQGLDLLDQGLDLLDLPGGGISKELFQKSTCHKRKLPFRRVKSEIPRSILP